mmetsp:Transcript_135145/g.259709  ORF Transcript_135145/g.259709 Transcript_135145/m.259709 type:complete len:111 (+) Transcript_135145:30-362(+)
MCCCKPVAPPPLNVSIIGYDDAKIYNVKLERSENQPWNMELDYGHPEGRGVRVVKVESGPITRHNQAMPHRAIKEGDWILRANEKETSNLSIAEEIKGKYKLEITVKKFL